MKKSQEAIGLVFFLLGKKRINLQMIALITIIRVNILEYFFGEMVNTAIAGRTLSRAGRQALTSAAKRQAQPGPSSSHLVQSTCTITRRSPCSSSSSSSNIRSFSTSSISKSDAPAVHLPPIARKDPKLFQSLRPPPKSAYVALAYRLKLISNSTDSETKQKRIALLVRACTHPSYITLVQRATSQYGQEAVALTGVGKGLERVEDANTLSIAKELEALDKQYVTISAEENHSSMATLGNSLLGVIASEYLHLRYPNLPNRVLKAVLSAYVGPNTLSDVATEMGIGGQGIVRWDSEATGGSRTMSRDTFSDALRAIVALMFQEQGLSSAREFVHAHLLSRLVPIATFLKFTDPKRSLSGLMKKLGKERPQSRMIAETGRLSINPVFVVGIWSGKEKLGEGTGSAIKMAEFRAAEDALRRFYLSETPNANISLPSITLDGELPSSLEDENGGIGFKDIWSIDQLPNTGKPLANAFRPAPLGMSEVIFGNKG